MKKIIVISLFFSLLMVTGCFEDSGLLSKSCVREDKINSLNSNIKYEFKFKKDKLHDLKIIYDYQDKNKSTIKSLKFSLKTKNNFLNLENKVLIDDDNHFRVEYNIPIEEEILERFNADISRTEMVNRLKKLGYVCN